MGEELTSKSIETFNFYNNLGVPLVGTVRKDGTINICGMNGKEVKNHFKEWDDNKRENCGQCRKW